MFAFVLVFVEWQVAWKLGEQYLEPCQLCVFRFVCVCICICLCLRKWPGGREKSNWKRCQLSVLSTPPFLQTDGTGDSCMRRMEARSERKLESHSQKMTPSFSQIDGTGDSCMRRMEVRSCKEGGFEPGKRNNREKD